MFSKATLLQFLSALSIVSTITVGVSASPAAEITDAAQSKVDGDLAPLDTFGNVVVCTDANLQGSCSTLGVTQGVCTCFTGGLASFNDKVSSMQFNLGGGATCTLYKDNNCGGQNFFVSNTAVINNFKDINFNDVMTCFKCFHG
ncbi:hypothetical protein R3P38DRAFT_2805035 [Favolaschia claudopus]|uniref:Uncharacterized protein n=1 Tax=Favolaschia claudopus TaxID=2862362 RepID=A0AAV9ZNC0_9AGAR